MSINRVVLTGRLTKDPELRQTASGLSVLSMRLAFNDRKKNQSTGEWEEIPNYIDVTVFGNRGEGLAPHVQKGTAIGVDGRLRWREWETPDGGKRSAIEVIADDIDFTGSRGDSGRGTGGGASRAPEADAASDDPGGEEIPF